MAQEVSNKEILEAINAFSSSNDNRLDGIDNRLDGIDKRLAKAEALMITKDYLDDKLSDLRGDLVVLLEKEMLRLKSR